MRERYAIPEFLTANDIKRVRNKLVNDDILDNLLEL